MRGGSSAAGSAAPIPEGPASELARRGAAGRSLVQPAAAPAPSGPAPEAGDPLSPFARYGQSKDLREHFERGRADTLRITAIATAMLFAGGGLMTLLLIGGIAGLLWSGVLEGGAEDDGNADDGLTHVLDTGAAGRPEVVSGRRAGPAREAAPVVDDSPKPGPITLLVPPDAPFREVEVSCGSGYRVRVPLRGGQAVAQAAPPNVKCTASFKGDEEARAPGVYANQSYTCTFNPTNCRVKW